MIEYELAATLKQICNLGSTIWALKCVVFVYLDHWHVRAALGKLIRFLRICLLIRKEIEACRAPFLRTYDLEKMWSDLSFASTNPSDTIPCQALRM